MLDALKKFIADLSDETESPESEYSRLQLAEAALMFHVIAIDGEVAEDEKSRMLELLSKQFGISMEETKGLFEEAREIEHAAIDLYGFTSVLKRQLNDHERLSIIENLWEMVFADGEVHELEDNVVWRIAELLNVGGRERMLIKRRVSERRSGAGQ